MPLSRSDKARLLLGVSLLAPMLTVQLMRMTLDGGPVSAPAATPAQPAAAGAASGQQPDIAVLLAAAKPLSPAQVRASEYLASHSTPADIKSPMDHPTHAAPAPESPVAEDEPLDPLKPAAATEEADPESKLVITSIFADRVMSRATINNSLRKVGDEVVFGWTLTQIDGRRGVITITSKSGRTLELSPKR